MAVVAVEQLYEHFVKPLAMSEKLKLLSLIAEELAKEIEERTKHSITELHGLGAEEDEMRRGKEGVMEAFKALQKALEEEQERLNDPAVTELLRMLGNERLRLVEWMIGEVQKLAAIWREGKAPVQVKTREIKPAGERLPRGKSLPQSFYRPLILKALAEMGGKGRVKEVLERVFELAKPYLSPVDLEFVPSRSEERWSNRVKWERFNMINDGLLRSDSPQGIWELTEAGWREAKRLMTDEAAKEGDEV